MSDIKIVLSAEDRGGWLRSCGRVTRNPHVAVGQLIVSHLVVAEMQVNAALDEVAWHDPEFCNLLSMHTRALNTLLGRSGSAHDGNYEVKAVRWADEQLSKSIGEGFRNARH